MARPDAPHVLIAGVTTRPFAVSAARAGYRVTAVDAFGDVDLRSVADVILARATKPGQSYGALEAAIAGSHVRADAVAYTSNFENYPRAVSRLVAGRPLLGNPAETLVKVRNPIAVATALRRQGLPGPATRSQPPTAKSPRCLWLLKPRRSGGGHGITRWMRGQAVPKGRYLQQRIAGLPGSISFAANGVSAVVLGFSRQLVGDLRLGAQPYRYCGSVLGSQDVRLFPRQEELLLRATELATMLTEQFRLVGLNGIDFIARQGIPYPIEVNPRYSASMELIERASGLSMFEVHSQACQGLLPRTPDYRLPAQGKAIVFAQGDTLIPRTSRWPERSWMADIPHAGDRIGQGRPICTVFATARDPGACRRLLWRRAAAVYRALAGAGRSAA